MNTKLFDYRMPIVAVGLGVGLASVFGILPFVDKYEQLIKFGYGGVIVIAAYVWYQHYHQRALKANALMKKGFHKTPYYAGSPDQSRQQPPSAAAQPRQQPLVAAARPRPAPQRPPVELEEMFEKGDHATRDT